MRWRVWLLRMAVVSFCLAAAGGGWLTYLHTNSEAVRRKVTEELQNHLTGVDVGSGAAWLRPLGGISLRDLRFTRRDDPNHPFLVVPVTTLYHHHAQLPRGRLAIRKFDIQLPTLL